MHGKTQLYRIRFNDYEPIIPDICVITGGPPSRRVRFRRHRFVGLPPIALWWTKDFDLPFSEEGYRIFRRSYPSARRMLEGLAAVCVQIPILGLLLFAVGYYCLLPGLIWPMALVGRIRRKRPLCRVRSFLASAFDVTVASKEFADAFCEANPTAECAVVAANVPGHHPPVKNRPATASLAVGLVGLGVPLLFPFSLFLGLRGLKKSRKTEGAGGGKGRAIAGITLGAYNLALSGVLAVVLGAGIFVGSSRGTPVDQAWERAAIDFRVREALGPPLVLPHQKADLKVTVQADSAVEREVVVFVHGSKKSGSMCVRTRKKWGTHRLRYVAVRVSGQEAPIIVMDH